MTTNTPEPRKDGEAANALLIRRARETAELDGDFGSLTTPYAKLCLIALANELERALSAPAAPTNGGGGEAAAREILAEEYERLGVGEGPYPTYAQLARTGTGSFTMCSIRAVQRALQPQPTQQGGAEELERLRIALNSAVGYLTTCAEAFATRQPQDADARKNRAGLVMEWAHRTQAALKTEKA